MPIHRVIHLDPPLGPSEEVLVDSWRVLVVDDHPMMRQIIGLACDDNPNLEVVGEAGDGAEALDRWAELTPDLIVLDVGIPEPSGLEVIRELRKRGAKSRILVLTGSSDATLAFECLRLDVDGYLDKLTAFEELGRIIEEVAEGKRSISRRAERSASKEFGQFVRHQREMSKTNALLTERELAVLEMIGRAYTNTQMARHLSLSERTIESHVARLYQKLDVRTRTAALRKGTHLGLISLTEEAAHA